MGKARDVDKRLGSVLCGMGYLSEVERGVGLQTQALWRRRGLDLNAWPLGRVLVRLGFVDSEQVAAALAHQAGLKVFYMSRRGYEPSPELIARVPEEVALQEDVLPLKAVEARLFLAVTRARDVVDHDSLRFRLGCALTFVMVPDPDMAEAHVKHYGAAPPDPNPVRVNTATHLVRGAALRSKGPIVIDLHPQHLRLRCSWSGAAHDHELPIGRAGQEEALRRLGLGDLWARVGAPRAYVELEVVDDRLAYLGEVQRTGAESLRLTLRPLP